MENLIKGENDVRRRLLDLLLRIGGTAPSSSVPVSEESVEVSDVILRASDLVRSLKLTERSAEEYWERMEAQKVEIRIEAQIIVA